MSTVVSGPSGILPRRFVDRTASDIITEARSRKVSATAASTGLPMIGAVGCSALAGLLMWACFAPLNLSPLAWIAPVPLLVLTRATRPVRRQMWACYLGGLAFYLPALQWLRLGDPAMYMGWFALAFYLAISFPLAVGLCRVAIHRWGVPLIVCGPIVWVALDYLKAHLMTGFAWYFLAHTQYRWLEIIQISDLIGAYGVTFVMMTAGCAVTSLIPDRWLVACRLVPASPVEKSSLRSCVPASAWPVAVSVAVFSVVLGYGVLRRGQADFQPGPRVALIQGNFLASLRVPPEDFGHTYLTHARLTGLAVREQPDLIVWPESMFRWPLTSSPSGLSDDELRARAPRVPPEFWKDVSVRQTLMNESQKTGASMIFGIETVDLKDRGIQQSNSAVFVQSDLGITGRYDKMHLVPFGEYLPLRDTLPFLQAFSPYPPDFGLHAGDKAAIFNHHSWRLAPIICFEDTVPHLVRGIVAAGSNREEGKPIDVLVNLSNDGWFHGSSGLDQHLITAAFRAVECRTPLVRAVNTGVSAIIDGDGAIVEPEVFIDGDRKGRTSPRDPKTGMWHKQLNAALVHTVPLDNRTSLYVRYGDWFAMLCCGATIFLGFCSAIPTRKPEKTVQAA